VGLAGFGECLPRFENFVEIDPSGQLDAFGIPVLRIQMTWVTTSAPWSRTWRSRARR
jgi:hypothetical protein